MLTSPSNSEAATSCFFCTCGEKIPINTCVLTHSEVAEICDIICPEWMDFSCSIGGGSPELVCCTQTGC